MTPIHPAAARSPRINFRSYPFSSMVGSTMPPMAATVAGPEPEIAAKNMQATTATMARPPVIRPKKQLKVLSSRLEMPPPLISSPAKTKKGTAIRGNESMAVTRF